MNCPFCAFLRGDAPRPHRYAEHGEVVSFEPRNPVTLGHLLFVPMQHVTDAAAWPDVTADTMLEASAWAYRAGEPCNLITSVGSEATQTVFHLHIHYVPRRGGDGLALPWTGQAKEADREH